MSEDVFTHSIATMSWIDPRTGLPEVDDGSDPGATSTRAVVVGRKAYRFSNLLEAWVRVADGVIIGHGFTSTSDMYRSPSFLRIPSQPIGIVRKIELIANGVRFRQLVGCRTQSPEVIGRGVGAGVGAGVGSILGPLGAAAGGYVGEKVGEKAAGKAKGFPPIWTELELTLWSDGTGDAKLIRHSLFPSLSYYTQQTLLPPGPYLSSTGQADNYNRVEGSYDGMPHYLDWLDKGWGGGNPWNYPKP
jgi:hypothetical protein